MLSPLMAVHRITEQGNRVCFGPGEGGSYIENMGSGDKIPLELQEGSYYLNVNFIGGGKTKVVVDSGAEESVCPWAGGENKFGTNEHPPRWLTFYGANCKKITHWGQRDVQIQKPF